MQQHPKRFRKCESYQWPCNNQNKGNSARNETNSLFYGDKKCATKFHKPCVYYYYHSHMHTKECVPFGGRSFHLAIIGRWLLFRGINNHNSNNISLTRCFAFRVRYSILAQNFYCHNKNWPKKKTETGFYEDRNGPLFIRLGDVDRNGLHALACVLLFFPVAGQMEFELFMMY